MPTYKDFSLCSVSSFPFRTPKANLIFITQTFLAQSRDLLNKRSALAAATGIYWLFFPKENWTHTWPPCRTVCLSICPSVFNPVSATNPSIGFSWNSVKALLPEASSSEGKFSGNRLVDSQPVSKLLRYLLTDLGEIWYRSFAQNSADCRWVSQKWVQWRAQHSLPKDVAKVVSYFLHFSQNSDKTLSRRHKHVLSDRTRSAHISEGTATAHLTVNKLMSKLATFIFQFVWSAHNSSDFRVCIYLLCKGPFWGRCAGYWEHGLKMASVWFAEICWTFAKVWWTHFVRVKLAMQTDCEIHSKLLPICTAATADGATCKYWGGDFGCHLNVHCQSLASTLVTAHSCLSASFRLYSFSYHLPLYWGESNRILRKKCARSSRLSHQFISTCL